MSTPSVYSVLNRVSSLATSIKSRVSMTIIAKLLFLVVASGFASLTMSAILEMPLNPRLFLYNLCIWSFWLMIDLVAGKWLIHKFVELKTIGKLLLLLVVFSLSTIGFAIWDGPVTALLYGSPERTVEIILYALTNLAPFYTTYGLIIFTVFNLVTAVSLLLDRTTINAQIQENQKQAEKPAKQNLQVASYGKIQYIKANQILRIESKNYYSELILEDESHLIRETLQSLKSKLEHLGFQRIHRSHIVNMKFVDEIKRVNRNSFVTVLKNSDEAPISRTYFTRFKQALDNYKTNPEHEEIH